ncbi:peptidase inhibitor family I36 protein [Streptomyces sp. 378]|uniref:peptidase inhibitor family I36 protein n=1 Tax=Streptomyces sp. 378 TaxID=3049412 RepID=UPI0024C2E752|nr:peptidase inhibitor family I36 protein [Streptomyces sp. 378]MDK1344686.1 peptidase inhibitor family I36 protein [Streptomyces sp. 378]
MRKFSVTAAVLGLAALGLAVPATAQAAESAVPGPVCNSKWGPRNGNMYAWQDLDCGGTLLIATPGNSSNWGTAANDKATSVMNRGYTGGLDHVAFYQNDNYGGGHACLAPGELYADNLTDNRFTNGVNVNDNITSHRWVARSACGAFLT